MLRTDRTTPIAEDLWHTDTVEVPTPRGRRYQGVTYGANRADVRYTSPLRIDENEAFEFARRRTVHHNLWHDGTPDAERIAHLHHAPDCHERKAVPA